MWKCTVLCTDVAFILHWKGRIGHLVIFNEPNRQGSRGQCLLRLVATDYSTVFWRRCTVSGPQEEEEEEGGIEERRRGQQEIIGLLPSSSSSSSASRRPWFYNGQQMTEMHPLQPMVPLIFWLQKIFFFKKKSLAKVSPLDRSSSSREKKRHRQQSVHGGSSVE